MSISKTNVVLILVSSLVSVIALEIFVRIFFEPLHFRPDLDDGPVAPHQKYGYFHRPNYRGTSIEGGRHVEFRTNSLGLRNPEIQDDPNVDNILVVGDSYTVGFGVNEDQAWPRLFEKILNDNEVSSKFRVINAAVSGYSLRQIRLLTEDLVEIVGPELVVLGLYTRAYVRQDDPFVFFRGYLINKSKVPELIPVSDGFYHTKFGQAWLIKIDIWMKRNLWLAAYLIDISREIYWKTFRNGIDNSREQSSGGEIDHVARLDGFLLELEKMSDAVRKKGVEFFVLLVNNQQYDGGFSDLESRLNAAVSQRCVEAKLVCIDMLQRFITEAKGRPIFRLGQDPHWTPRAHELVANEFARQISPWWAKSESAPP